MSYRRLAAVLVLPFLAIPRLAHANGYGTDVPWQFQTTTDAANKAVVEDMIQKKIHNGYGPAQSYTTINNNTNIAKQVNCDLTATAYGNYAIPGISAGVPVTSGASSSSIGNTSTTSNSASNTSTLTPGGTNSQSNTGAVASNLTGSTSVVTSGPYYQALNSTQTNGGTQTASIANSTACTGTVN